MTVLRYTEEHEAFRHRLQAFISRQVLPNVAKWEADHLVSKEAWQAMGREGFLCTAVESRYGGLGGDFLFSVICIEEMARTNQGGFLTFLHSDIVVPYIERYGTAAQKEKYLPGCVSGDIITAVAMTEPDAGSDVAAMTTRAEKRGDRYVLNGTKMFITNGPVADVAVVYAKTGKDLKHAGISAFIVEKGRKGFSAGNNLIKMGVRTSHTSELILEDCEIPETNRIGREGEGFLMAMQTVEWDRSALLAPFVGGMTYVLKKCARYARERHQFGRPIGRFQATQHKLADIKIFIEAARSLYYRIAWYKDQGRPLNHLEAAVAKLFVGDWSLGPANDAMLLFGGYGYCHEYEVERFFRDSRLAPIGGGTSDIQKKIISKLI